MKQTALVVDSSRLYQGMIKHLLASLSIECTVFSSATDALNASHLEYDFIFVSGTLSDLTGDIFLDLYSVQHGIKDAFTILLTSNEDASFEYKALNSGFNLIHHKSAIDVLHDILIQVINKRTLSLDGHILIVEDSNSIANQTAELFAQYGCNSEHAIDCHTMQDLVDNGSFNLIITDYYLKGRETGDDVIEYVRSHPNQEKSSIPILVVSSESNHDKRISFLRKGANDFIIKPYDTNELLVRSSNLMHTHKIIKQFKQQQQDLMKLASTDQLTGLYNRHTLFELAPKYISNAFRLSASLSMLVIDIDHFKAVNDEHGHSVGDLVLSEVAKALQRACRKEDIAVRFGGEEFVLVFTNCNSENALWKAETIRQEIQKLHPNNLAITVSIGVAELHSNDDLKSLFVRADSAVYQAKNSGRNKVCILETPREHQQN